MVSAGDYLGLVRFGNMIFSTVDPSPIASFPLPSGLDDGLKCWRDLVLSVRGDDRSAVAMPVVPVQVDCSIPFPVSCVKMGEDSRESRW